MPDFPQTRYDLEPTLVAVNHDEEEGYILRADGRLTAVLIRLDAEYNGEHRGCWYLEAGFGACAGIPPTPFLRLRDAVLWIADRLGGDVRLVDDAVIKARHRG